MNCHMLKLGNIKLDMPFFQAPLSGYSDWAMRIMAKEFGCPLTYTGVMLAKSAANPRVLRRPEFRPGSDEGIVGAQILGTEPDIMTKAAKDLVNVGYDTIDLNFACPAPKVLRRHRGGYMLKTPELVLEIYKQVRDAINCPLTAKIRIGYGNGDESQDNFWKIIEGFANYGINAVVVHGRTTLQKYAGKADWTRIKQVKDRFPNLTVVGSGDIYTPEDITSRLEETGIDGILVARGAVGNPWIFQQTRAKINGQFSIESPSLQEQGKIMIRHFLLLEKIHESNKCVPYFRKFVVRYCKLHPERKKAHLAIFEAKNRKEFFKQIEKFYGVTPEAL